jgi:tripartite-type tricarboxylate transporter receptor subunit TctC
MNRRRLAAALVAALLIAACGGQRSAEPEAYPSEQIRLIVPYTAGDPTDIAARALGKFMETSLGKKVVVENLPGDFGSTAYQRLVSAEPDGNTLSMTALPTAVLNYLTDDVGYTREDFAPVGVIAQVPSVFIVPSASPHNYVGAFFADASNDPPFPVTVGTPGATSAHAAEIRRITQLHGVPLTILPMNGAQEVLKAVMSGNINAGFINASQDVMSAIKSGSIGSKVRVLAVGTEKRVPYLKAQTFVEQGYPEITRSTTTFGVIAPAGTPQPVIARLEETMRAASADPETRHALDERYLPEQFMGSADLATLFAEAEQTFQGAASGG